MNDEPPLHKIIRRRDLPEFTGLQRTQLSELIARGEFPRPIPLSDSGRAVGWLWHEVVGWQRQRLAKRDADIEQSRNLALSEAEHQVAGTEGSIKKESQL
jgi:prophage regulatory protein